MLYYNAKNDKISNRDKGNKISRRVIHKMNKAKKIFFVGIGGTSVSGLAQMAKHNGYEVCGSDMRACIYTDKLIAKGIDVKIGHSYDNVPEDTDLLVHSAAINMNIPEMVYAKDHNIPCMERSYFLGELSKLYKKTIAVSGTHGKTTTSSLTALLLLNAALDPSVSIGGTLEQINGNVRNGDSDYFVIEACEFIDSFLRTEHFIGTILNIEEDHLDYFTGGIDQIASSFKKFADILPEDGLLIANGDDKCAVEIAKTVKANVQTFGLTHSNDWYADNIKYDSVGKPSFDVIHNDKLYGTFSLNIPGQHNIMNSLSVIICADFLGIDIEIVKKTFLEFVGAKRRFEFKGEEKGIKVFEDYAHHPTELKVTINACKNYEHNKLWVVFQPHTYSRTSLLFDEFVDACADADEVIFNDIYSDREANNWNIYSENVVEKIWKKYNIQASVISNFDDIVKHISKNAQSGDLVLVAGSQSINEVAVMLVEELQ